MPATGARIVVDTSVIVKWFKTHDEELLDQAGWLLRRVDQRALEVHAPALLLYEIGNLLLVGTRLDADGLDDAFRRIAALPLILAPPAVPLLQRSARLGRACGLTFYDASFVALAEELGCPFVTADRRLHRRVRSLPRMVHLSDVQQLP